MAQITRVKYIDTTLPAASETVTLVDTTTIETRAGKLLGENNIHKVQIDLRASNTGTLKPYKSPDGGTTWYQMDSVAVTAMTTTTLQHEWDVAMLPDFKLEFVNSTTTQTVFDADVCFNSEIPSADIALENIDVNLGDVETLLTTIAASAATTMTDTAAIKASTATLMADLAIVKASTITMCARTPALGAATAAASTPVVFATDQYSVTTCTLSDVLTAAAGPVVGSNTWATMGNLADCESFAITRTIQGGTGGTTSIWLQNSYDTTNGTDGTWTDWARYADQTTALAATTKTWIPAMTNLSTAVGTGTAAALAADTFIGGHPGKCIRHLISGSTAMTAATQTTYIRAIRRKPA